MNELQKLFKSYIHIEGSDKTHALYSPSGMDRILGCPGSVELSKGIKSESNAHSIIGTHTHTLMEFILNHGEAPLRDIASLEFKKHIGYTSQMHQAAMMAVRHTIAVGKKMRTDNGKDPVLEVEHKIKLQHIVNADCSGTADIKLFQLYGVLHIMDYKNGTGVVEVEENKQLMTYALGAVHEHGWDFSEVILTIIQPNAKHASGPIRSWRLSLKRLEQFEQELTAGIKASQAPNAPLVLNYKWCYWCPAKLKCPLQKDIEREKVLLKFKKPNGGSDGKKENYSKEENYQKESGEKSHHQEIIKRFQR